MISGASSSGLTSTAPNPAAAVSYGNRWVYCYKGPSNETPPAQASTSYWNATLHRSEKSRTLRVVNFLTRGFKGRYGRSAGSHLKSLARPACADLFNHVAMFSTASLLRELAEAADFEVNAAAGFMETE